MSAWASSLSVLRSRYRPRTRPPVLPISGGHAFLQLLSSSTNLFLTAGDLVGQGLLLKLRLKLQGSQDSTIPVPSIATPVPLKKPFKFLLVSQQMFNTKNLTAIHV